MNVHVLTITHKHGDNVTLHLTEKDAHDALVAYVDEWWGQEIGEDVAAPGDDDERVAEYFEHCEREGAEISEATFGEVIRDNDARVTYEPWTNGTVMGFKCTQANQPDEYIYLNPSGGSDDGAATVFVYIGPKGDPANDQAVHHYAIGEGWG